MTNTEFITDSASIGRLVNSVLYWRTSSEVINGNRSLNSVTRRLCNTKRCSSRVDCNAGKRGVTYCCF